MVSYHCLRKFVLKEKGFPNSLWQKIQNSHLTKMLTILGATEKAEEPLLI